MVTEYTIPALIPYINWIYFFHAWEIPLRFASIAQVHACPSCRASWLASFSESEQPKAKQARRLYDDAMRLMSRMAGKASTKAIVRLYDCVSDDNDILILDAGRTTRLPMLRQQTPSADGYCWCMSDFIRPASYGEKDRIGIFATTTDLAEVCCPNADDAYERLLAQTVADRLAEAAAEMLHEYVRRTLWGYAPNERLTMAELHAEHFQGIRPAVGYPSLPDMSLNFFLDNLLSFSTIGITLTESGMMRPHSSVSGLMISHPKSRYFDIGIVLDDQLTDYARRRSLPKETIRKFIRHS